MGEDDFRSVCTSMKLASGHGLVHPDPALGGQGAGPQAIGKRVALYAPNGVLQGVMTVKEVFLHDKKLEIPNVFRTEDSAHPGVAQVQAEADHCIAGPVDALTLCVDPNGPEAFL
jgi:sulfate adenylyltransferase